MKYTVNKIDAAADQLDWAIKLFLDHGAYVSSITLAGAAEEIVGEAVSTDAAFHKLKEILFEKTGLEVKIISQEHLNKTKNWLKHWKNLKDDESLEIELENEAIQYLVRAMTNFAIYDNSVTSETPRFYEWLVENKKELINGL